MNTPEKAQIRASDAEREVYAERIQQAGSEGRLTLPEVEERLTQVYAAKFRPELEPLVADLPAPPDPAPNRWRGPAARSVRGVPGPLVVHAIIAAFISVMMIVRWTASDAEFFWPIFPMFWLWMSVAVHARIRLGRWRRCDAQAAARCFPTSAAASAP
ncbi:MAG TPA: DUF1707 domain-containing protein [Mycobacteriales bacterium]|nr:DUF1707 domain-containing protein [Mycobacteriales bacterium]